jgi:hypothetical protein
MKATQILWKTLEKTTKNSKVKEVELFGNDNNSKN